MPRLRHKGTLPNQESSLGDCESVPEVVEEHSTDHRSPRRYLCVHSGIQILYSRPQASDFWGQCPTTGQRQIESQLCQ